MVALHREDVLSKNADIVETKSLSGSEQIAIAKGGKTQYVASQELTDVLAIDPPKFFSLSTFRLFAIIIVGCLNATLNGFDSSTMSGVNAMTQWHDYFDTGIGGSTVGAIFAMYMVGSIIGSFFAGPASDMYGRRVGMVIGSIFVIIGTVLQSTAPSSGQFMGGRILLGIGVSISSSAGPAYVVEICHPKWRGILMSLYNGAFFYFGAIAATWTTYGSQKINSDWAWRIPTLLQLAPSVVVIMLSLFLPESPRWLLSRGKVDQAIKVFAKYHGNGNPEHPIVSFQVREIQASLGENRSDKRWWDYRELFNSRAARYRFWLLFAEGFLGNFLGGAVIAYYSPIMLTNAGITNPSTQLLINAINTIISMLSAIAGSFVMDYFGRRKMFLFSTTGTLAVFIIITALSAVYANGGGKGGSYAFTVFLILYGVFFSAGWTPLQYLYPSEILTYETRAKGMGAYGFVTNVGNVINTYAAPIGMVNITWKFYLVFIVVHALYIPMLYFTFPETKGRTLEELNEVFTARNPVKKSLELKKVIVKENEGVIASADGFHDGELDSHISRLEEFE